MISAMVSHLRPGVAAAAAGVAVAQVPNDQTRRLHLTQSKLVEMKQKEQIPMHRHFVPGGGMYNIKPDKIDKSLVLAELDKMKKGDKDAALYLAYQPILIGSQEDCEEPEMFSDCEEQLLRAKDNNQAFPTTFLFHMSNEERMEFCMWATQKAIERAKTTGRCVQVNWWEQDMQIMKPHLISLCGGENVMLELTEYKRDGNEGYPTLTPKFTEATLDLLRSLKDAGVKTSLDDMNWIQENHPCSPDFAVAAAEFLDQVKLDIKACAEVYDTIPEGPAANVCTLEADPVKRLAKLKRLECCVEKMLLKNPNLIIVIELSVCTSALAMMVPFLNPFANANVRVQGGRTGPWAMHYETGLKNER